MANSYLSLPEGGGVLNSGPTYDVRTFKLWQVICYRYKCYWRITHVRTEYGLSAVVLRSSFPRFTITVVDIMMSRPRKKITQSRVFSRNRQRTRGKKKVTCRGLRDGQVIEFLFSRPVFALGPNFITGSELLELSWKDIITTIRVYVCVRVRVRVYILRVHI